MRRVIAASAAAALLLLFCLPARAADVRSYTFSGEEKPDPSDEALTTLYESLPDELRALLPDGGIEDSSSLFSNSAIAENIESNLGSLLLPSVGAAARLVALLLIAALFYTFRDAVSGDGIRRALSFVISGAGILAILDMEIGVLAAAENYVQMLCRLMTALLTAMTSVCIGGGAAHLAALTGTEMMMLVTGAAALFSALILPLCGVCMALAAVGSLDGIKTGSLLKAIHYTATLTLSVLGLVLGLLIAGEAKLASSADSLRMQGIKFAVSSFIPLVGGALSGAVGTLSGSFTLIKDSVGGVGIFLIVALAAPALLNLLVNRFVILLGKSMAEMLGCEREKTMLEEVGTVFTFVMAIVAVITVLFVLLIVICLNVRIGGNTL